MIIYQEFDVMQSNLISELISRITAHPDWSVLTPTPLVATLTSSTSTSSMIMTVDSTAGFMPNQRIRVDYSTYTYYKTVVTVDSPTQMTVSAGSWGRTMAIGTTITAEHTLIKGTTTRGAEMIVDLKAGTDASELYRMDLRFWQNMPASYGAAVPTDSVDRYLYFRTSGGTGTQTIHVTLSVSKEHLFVALEGPRAHEVGTFNTTYGSLKSYMFFSDLVPYHASDTIPCVIASAGTNATASSSVDKQSHIADLSRTAADDESWQGCRMASLTFPTVQDVTTVAMERDSQIDGSKYLFPYVVFGNKEGIRGRLSRFFYAGSTDPSSYADSAAPVGERVTFDGIVYRLIAVNKGDGTSDSWGAFGAADNSVAAGIGRSVVVAVPYAEVVTP